ncbi:MAG TPA: amidophosphoribosyltransferase [Patescibacteria group bacterium]|nr:amidophosphoribosyltransferase [Patescibacteria group bacterium]
MAEIAEKCAVTAIVGTEDQAAVLAYDALFAMQHRGPEATGIATQSADGGLEMRRGLGMVRDVYSEADMNRLAGTLAIGHNRYSTSGSKKSHPQPVVDEHIGFAFGHNGNLPVTHYLRTFLEKHNIIASRLNDSEMMGQAIAQYLRSGHDLPDAVELAYPLFRGAFSCVGMHDGVVVAFRDPKGIRPLALGEIADEAGGRIGMAAASETCGLDTIGARYTREVEPGEMVIITRDGVESRRISDGEDKLDMFEMVYFARRDSMLYGMPVDAFRRRCGQQLAKFHEEHLGDISDALVIPIPDTSAPAAEGFAKALGLEYAQAIVKNPYTGRTFLNPSDKARMQQLRRKHNAVPGLMKGRHIIYVDDSYVRGKTTPRLHALAVAEGAESVTFLMASPPVRFPDFYGIDTPSQDELPAANLTVEQMRRRISEDQAKECRYLGFLPLSLMVAASDLPASKFNLAPFNGEYPIGIGNRKSEIRTPVSMEYAE